MSVEGRLLAILEGLKISNIASCLIIVCLVAVIAVAVCNYWIYTLCSVWKYISIKVCPLPAVCKIVYCVWNYHTVTAVVNTSWHVRKEITIIKLTRLLIMYLAHDELSISKLIKFQIIKAVKIAIAIRWYSEVALMEYSLCTCLRDAVSERVLANIDKVDNLTVVLNSAAHYIYTKCIMIVVYIVSILRFIKPVGLIKNRSCRPVTYKCKHRKSELRNRLIWWCEGDEALHKCTVREERSYCSYLLSRKADVLRYLNCWLCRNRNFTKVNLLYEHILLKHHGHAVLLCRVRA